MRKKAKKIMSMLLSAAMISGSVSGPAFAAGAEQLFADGEIPILIKSEEQALSDLDELYAGGVFRIASAANAALKNDPDAEVVASDSDALEVEAVEPGGDDDSYWLMAAWLEGLEIPADKTSVMENVELRADGKIFKGKVEVRRNWMHYNNISLGSRVSAHVLTPNKPAEEYDGSETMSVKVYDGFDSDEILDGVTAEVDKVWQKVKLDFSGLSETADEAQEMRVEVYAGKARIGYCYLTLPPAPDLTVNGESVGNQKISEYLGALDENEKAEITEIKIPDGSMDYTDWEALKELANLERLTVAAGVTREVQGGGIPSYCFRGNTSLKYVSLNDGRTSRSNDNSGFISIERGAFDGCTSLEQVIAPGITRIEAEAFKDCASLSDILLDDVESVGQEAFAGCESLQVVALPKAAVIYNSAFAGCKSLMAISVSSVYHFGSGAFSGCENLMQIILSASVPSLAENTFEGVTLPLQYVLVDKDGTALTGEELDHALSSYGNASPSYWVPVLGITIKDPNNPNIPPSQGFSLAYKKAGDEDYSYQAGGSMQECLEAIGEPEKIVLLEVRFGTVISRDWIALQPLTSLETLEFHNAKMESSLPGDVRLSKTLRTLNLGGSRRIPSHAFKDFKNLELVSMESVTDIGDGAFEGCERLARFILPKYPPTLGEDVFKGCTAAEKSAALYNGDAAPYLNADPQWRQWVSYTPQKPDRPSTGGFGGGSSDTDNGKWMLDERGWWYEKDNGYYLYSQWSDLEYNGVYERYYFGADGYMATGWYTDLSGRTYYLHPVADGTRGRMYKGWNLIDGKWYYFSTEFGDMFGALLKNTTTPDGYAVDENGAWIQ